MKLVKRYSLRKGTQERWGVKPTFSLLLVLTLNPYWTRCYSPRSTKYRSTLIRDQWIKINMNGYFVFNVMSFPVLAMIFDKEVNFVGHFGTIFFPKMLKYKLELSFYYRMLCLKFQENQSKTLAVTVPLP